jgi:hypothetical protein
MFPNNLKQNISQFKEDFKRFSQRVYFLSPILNIRYDMFSAYLVYFRDIKSRLNDQSAANILIAIE